ncbi:serine hydrolase domain-containing protein [Undibacterium sp. Ren11W]|uniref:serine hydrolase domain-containing protein n=1 Tax=Undibacterium sp. Ren11W TaxID=3413045 RepID=UPI003BEF97F3
MHSLYQPAASGLNTQVSLLRALIACSFLASSTYALAADVALPSVKSLAGQCDAVLQPMPQTGTGTVVLAARKGELICASARGMADIELGIAMTPEQKFRIGSISKQFTAVALLKLIDQGKAKLDDPLSNYLSDFPNGGQISLLQLLNHTAGVSDFTNVPKFAETTQRIDVGTEDLVKLIAVLPVDFAPGSAWRYSNSGYILLSAVIEKITGKSWHEALDELLIKPLELKDTSWENPQQVWPGLVRGYQANQKGGIAPASPISMTVPQGAGALISSAKDLWRWNEALHGGRVISAASYQQLTTPQGAAIKDKYGFGIGSRQVRGHAALWHNGGINGFASDLMYLPESGTTLVQLNNFEGPTKPYSMKLAAQLIGDPFVALTPEKWNDINMKAAQGVYAKNGVTRTIKFTDGKLYSQRQGGRSLELITATQQRIGFEADPLSWMELEIDAQRKITGLKFYPQGNNVGEVWLRQGDLPAQTAALALSEEQIARVLGSYTSPVFSTEVRRNAKGGLEVQAQGQPASDIVAVGPNKFKLTVVDATLEFDGQGSAAESVMLRQGEKEIKLLRIKVK